MGNKLSFDFVKDEFHKRGFTLLEVSYINAQTHMRYICSNGHKVQITWNNFKKGAGCPFCGGTAKLSYEFIKEEFNKRGYTLLSENYINARSKLEYLCTNDHKCEITWDKFKQGRGCMKCSGNEKHSYEYIVNEFEKEGYKLLTKTYKHAHQILVYICANNHECRVRYNKFQQGDRCNTCSTMKAAEKLRKTQEQFEREVYDLVKNEYVVLGNYANIDTHVLMKHIKCDHEWDVNPYHFLKGGTRCPNCSSSKGESFIYEYLKSDDINFVFQYKSPDCVNNRALKFDFAIFEDDKLKCLIEYDGIQHFEPVEYFGGEKGFNESKKRDEIKNNYCKSNNIPLIRIPYWEFSRIKEILENIL